MKKILAFTSVLLAVSCGIANNRTEQLDERLQGTWVDTDTTVAYTFSDGHLIITDRIEGEDWEYSFYNDNTVYIRNPLGDEELLQIRNVTGRVLTIGYPREGTFTDFHRVNMKQLRAVCGTDSVYDFPLLYIQALKPDHDVD